MSSRECGWCNPTFVFLNFPYGKQFPQMDAALWVTVLKTLPS